MHTYDDIQTLTPICEIEDITPIDLRAEAQQCETDNEPWEAWTAGAYNSEGITILWIPGAQRAGLAWGADAQWTDADSVEDALQRFFGVDDKEMIN